MFKILVVDDEAAILKWMEEVISSLGHRAFTFLGGNIARTLTIVEAAAADRFDFAIVDIVMPGIDGFQLIGFIHRVSPCTKLICAGPLSLEMSDEFMKRGLFVAPLSYPPATKDIGALFSKVISSPSLVVAKGHNAEEEIRLRNQVSNAVHEVLFKYNAGDLSWFGREHEHTLKRIVDFILDKCPGSADKVTMNKLSEMISVTLGRGEKSAKHSLMATEIFSMLPAPLRGVGLLVIKNVRYYTRYCTWCKTEIPKKQTTLVVYGARKRGIRPRFCSDDCYKSWESIYWQKLAIQNLPPYEKEIEESNLRSQILYTGKYLRPQQFNRKTYG